MAKLLIFIDESGTMPFNLEKNIFAAAGVGTFNNYPIFDGKKGYKTWLVGQLNKHKAIPYISFIEPNEEYINTIKQRFNDIEQMAQTTLETTGNNKKYFSAYGLDQRNMIWMHTINNCIGQIILNSTIAENIDEITIYLDQKTLKTTSLNLFTNQIIRKLLIINGSLDKIHNIPKSFINFVRSRLNWQADKVRIVWSNEPEALPATFGLELAHYLGYHFCKDYKKKETPKSLHNLLINAGYLNFYNKTNSLLTKEIDEKPIQDWEKNTGFRFRE